MTFTTYHGWAAFSELVQQRLVHINRSESVGKAFIGSIDRSSFGESSEWKGDELELHSARGRIKVAYSSEASEEEGGGLVANTFGFFKKRLMEKTVPRLAPLMLVGKSREPKPV